MTESKKIGLKNYLILGLIFLLTIILVLYLCKCYKVYNESQKNIPVIENTLTTVMPTELEHYVLDNPTTIVYMCTASATECRNYEKDLKKLVLKKDLTDKMVYLNLSNENIDEFIKTFNDKYKYKTELTGKLPAIVIFEDGKAIHILQSKKNKPITISKTNQLLELNEIGE